MSVTTKTLVEISVEAEKALYARLGVADAVRYLRQFQPRNGNYTEERDPTFGGRSVDEIVELIHSREQPNA